MTDEKDPSKYAHKFGSIKTPADLKAIPGYCAAVDFSEAAGRRLQEMHDHYDFLKEDEYPCGIKGCATTHQHGYLVSTSDGIFTNIGRICGAKYLDLDFDRVRKEYRIKRKASDSLASLTEIRANFSAHQDRLDSVISRVNLLAKCRKFLFEAMPNQFATSISMSKKGLREVVVIRRMSKREASIHFAQTNTSGKDYEGRRPTLDVVVGNLAGGDIFKENIDDLVRNEIIKPLSEIKSITDFSLSTLTDKKLEDLSRNTNNAIRLISKAEDLVNQGVRFYSPDNIKLFEYMGAESKVVSEAISKLAHIVPTPISKPEKPLSEPLPQR